MWSVVRVPVLVTSIALTSCATSPRVSCPPPARDSPQLVMLRTDPPGATCSVSRGGVVVASVELTPDFASVPRRNETIEIVCRKGNLESTMGVVAVPASEVKEESPSTRECAPRQPSAAEAAGEVIASSVVQGVATFFPPAALGMLVAGVAITAAAQPKYAYPRPPELILAPTSFDSESACAEYFGALKSGLEATAGAALARVNETCHPWPCNASDRVCPSPTCAAQRAAVEAELVGRLSQIPNLRARVCNASP